LDSHLAKWIFGYKAVYAIAALFGVLVIAFALGLPLRLRPGG